MPKRIEQFIRVNYCIKGMIPEVNYGVVCLASFEKKSDEKLASDAQRDGWLVSLELRLCFASLDAQPFAFCPAQFTLIASKDVENAYMYLSIGIFFLKSIK